FVRARPSLSLVKARQSSALSRTGGSLTSLSLFQTLTAPHNLCSSPLPGAQRLNNLFRGRCGLTICTSSVNQAFLNQAPAVSLSPLPFTSFIVHFLLLGDGKTASFSQLETESSAPRAAIPPRCSDHECCREAS